MTIGDMNNIYVFMALMLGLGVFFLFFARHIQRHAQKSVTRGISRHLGLDAFVSSTSYLIMIRGMGLIMLALFAFLMWLAFKTG